MRRVYTLLLPLPHLLLPCVHGKVAEENRARVIVLAALGPVHADVLAPHVRTVGSEGLDGR